MSVQEIKLKNGLRLVVDPMPGLESVALGVWAGAGARVERPEEHGIAHLLEHMAFKGTRRRTARAIVEEIESVGGHLNAATGYERTGYYARVLKGDVDLALDLLSDILRAPLLAEADLAREQDVVVQEIGEARDEPGDYVFDLLQSAAWGDHTLGRPILGTQESVRAQTPDSLAAFMGRHYGADNLVLAAAGAVDAEAFAKAAETVFADWPHAGHGGARVAATFQGGARSAARTSEQMHLALSFPGFGVADPLYYASRVFAEALGGGMSSRLFQTVREERGLAYSVYAYADPYADAGALGVYAGADPARAGEVPSLVIDEIRAMAERPEAAEVDRARAQLKSALLMSQESPAARAESAAGQTHVFGRVTPLPDLADRIDAVDAAAVAACAEKALSAPLALAAVGGGEAAFDYAVIDALRAR
ncbi:MAG: pitrilysin family protein [Pseudomonadota bacterium]